MYDIDSTNYYFPAINIPIKEHNIENKDYFYNETKPRQTNEKEYCYNYNIYISAIRMQQTTIRI